MSPYVIQQVIFRLTNISCRPCVPSSSVPYLQSYHCATCSECWYDPIDDEMLVARLGKQDSCCPNAVVPAGIRLSDSGTCICHGPFISSQWNALPQECWAFASWNSPELPLCMSEIVILLLLHKNLATGLRWSVGQFDDGCWIRSQETGSRRLIWPKLYINVQGLHLIINWNS